MIYPDNNQKRSRKSFKGILIAAGGIAAGFLISRIFFLSFSVVNASMGPGLVPGDRVIIMKYLSPARGDIVLLRSPAEPDRVLLRRIIAADGDSVEVKNGIIYVNDTILRPSWKVAQKDKRVFPMYFSLRDNMPVIRVKRGEFFVLGDNPDHAFDSRIFGVVHENALIGKAVYGF